MSADPWIGKKVGPCRMEKLIGEGAMGIVYLASHLEMSKKVAVKILHPALLGGEKGDRTKKRFQQEAYWGLTLKHPNIVQVYKAGQQNSTAYIVMEYVAGKSLAQILQEEGPRNEMETLQIAREVTLALKAAHQKGVIHRDIKPANILIADSGDVKLSDFGLAKPLGEISEISQTGQIIGTVFYMSPEQAKGSRKIDYRADFYALGATLFQMLTGRVPYPGRTPLQVLQQHISASVPRLSDYAPGTLPQTEKLVSRLMQKDLNLRFSDAEELLDCINSCQTALRQSRTKGKEQKGRATPTRSNWAIGVFAVLVFLSFCSYLFRNSPGIADATKNSSTGDEKEFEIVELFPDGSTEINSDQVVVMGKIRGTGDFSLWINGEKTGYSPLPNGLWQFSKRLRLPTDKNKVELLVRREKEVLAERSLMLSRSRGNHRRDLVFSIGEVSIVDQNGKQRHSFRPGEQIFLEVHWEIKKISEELDKILTIAGDGPGRIRTVSKKLGKAIVESNFLREPIRVGDMKPGRYSVRVSLIIGETIREAVVQFKVATPPKDLVRISLQPMSLVLRPEEEFQFSVKGFNSWNIETEFTPSWIASGGSIEPDGRYTAGEKTGDFIIIARDPETRVQAKATVHIRLDSPPRDIGWFGEKMPMGMGRGVTPGEYIWEKDQSTMVYVPKGNFWRGSNSKPNERPIEQVRLKAYYIDKYEVTWKKYSRFCTETGHEMPNRPPWGMQENHPVVNISWNDSRAYAKWAGKRLPTELEWEKAARGGFKIPNWKAEKIPIPLVLNTLPRRRYPWGDEAPNSGRNVFRCNYVANDIWQQRDADGYATTAPVGSFFKWSSPYGCADMAGNVWEWCRDIYVSRSATAHLSMPAKKALKGGSWYNHADSCRATRREYSTLDEKSDFVGMRLAK